MKKNLVVLIITAKDGGILSAEKIQSHHYFKITDIGVF